RTWLQFGDVLPEGGAPWFGNVLPVPCRVSWTEDASAPGWQGIIHRVERFDQQTRQVSLAIRLDRNASAAADGGLPLVDGMFCKVDIPGKTMRQVYRLPRWAVTFEGQVYVVEDGQLKIRKVDVVRNQGEETFVGEGLQPGDEVIV